MVFISECQKLLKSILAHTTNGNGWNHGEHVLFFSVASPHLRILNRPSRCSRSSSASSLSSPRPRPSLPLPAMVLVSSRRCFSSGEEIKSDDPSMPSGPLNAPGSGTLGLRLLLHGAWSGASCLGRWQRWPELRWSLERDEIFTICDRLA